MRLTSLLPLLLLFACSSESTPPFTDAATAMDQAEQALVANDYLLAADAFRFAATDEAFTADALQGLFRAQADGADADGAIVTLATLKANHSEVLSTSALKSLADTSINAGQLILAEEVVAMNLALHPDAMEAFRAVIDGIEAKRSGDVEALAELGYVGD